MKLVNRKKYLVDEVYVVFTRAAMDSFMPYRNLAFTTKEEASKVARKIGDNSYVTKLRVSETLENV